MANYFGPNSAAWTARSGVVLDPEKNGPMPFNGAPNMNMIMSQGMQHSDVQQGSQKSKDVTSNGDTMNLASTQRLISDQPTSNGPVVSSVGVMHPAMLNSMMTPQSITSSAAMGFMPGMQPLNSSAMSIHNHGVPLMNSSVMSGQGLPAYNTMGRSIAPTMNSTAVHMANLPLMNANIPPNMFMQTVNFDVSQNHDDMNRTMG